jgi:flagellar motor component MotA
MIHWNAELARRLQCRDDEKKGLAPLIRRLLDLDRIARTEGFQALEPELATIGDPLLSIGLRLVMEGVSEEALEEILATYVMIDERSGWPFLRSCVIVEGLLAIAEVDDPALMARKLIAYYGADKAAAALEELERDPAIAGNAP